MSLSQFAKSIAESPTLALNEQARILKEKGEDVIHLGAGEPKNKAPIDAILHATAKLSVGDIKYTPTAGIPSLKKAVVKYTEENYGSLVKPENILISAGAKQALYNLLVALLDPKEEVIVLAPYWVSYPEMIRMAGGVAVIVPPEEATFCPSLRRIEAAVTPRTKAIIVNSPNNPSGVMYPERLIAELVEFSERKGITLVMDDIYHKLIFDGKTPISPYRFTKKDIESTNIVSINGISKLYGMTGFRIGWVVAPKEVVKVMSNVQAQITSCTSVVLQAGAEGALTGPQSVVDSLRLTLENNRNVMMQELQSIHGLKVTKPDGTYYCLPDFRAFNKSSVELSRFLLEKALVVTVPGKEFGMEGFIRLSYATTIKDVQQGVARIKWAIDPTSPKTITIGNKQIVRDWL